ncbi:MAG: hypothetical protein KIT72_04725 [Polyangiaceae bacterium]|nr:hypothetical protein [Polyangiaceae bacterium]
MVVLIAIVGLVVVGGSIGGLAAYFSSSAPKPVASTAPMTTALPALPSSWVAKDGAQYRLEQDGSRIELVIADMGKGHLGPGEVEFVLIKPERGAETYRVSHTLRPLLPTKSMYDEAGYTSCLRTITSVEGSALVARVSPQKIEIEMAVLELPARAFKRSPRTGKIVACDGLGTAEAFRRTMQLVPNRSGD